MKIPKPIIVDEISSGNGFIVLEYLDFGSKRNSSLFGECLTSKKNKIKNKKKKERKKNS